MGPQDIKLAPDGSVFYIADSDQNGVWVLDGAATKVAPGDPHRSGAHGLYLSRDATQLYVTNRHEGSVSVLDAYTGASLAKWRIPGGARARTWATSPPTARSCGSPAATTAASTCCPPPTGT